MLSIKMTTPTFSAKSSELTQRQQMYVQATHIHGITCIGNATAHSISPPYDEGMLRLRIRLGYIAFQKGSFLIHDIRRGQRAISKGTGHSTSLHNGEANGLFGAKIRYLHQGERTQCQI